MIKVRPFDLERDHPTLMGWWRGHGAAAVLPKFVFEAPGVVAEAGGVEIAMGIVYVAYPGNVAVIEWLSTNPKCAYSKTLIQAWKAVLETLEATAKELGAKVIISFCKPNSGEERLMAKLGYVGRDPHDPGHLMYAKPIGVCQ